MLETYIAGMAGGIALCAICWGLIDWWMWS
jgi:hypothetical protein